MFANRLNASRVTIESRLCLERVTRQCNDDGRTFVFPSIGADEKKSLIASTCSRARAGQACVCVREKKKLSAVYYLSVLQITACRGNSKAILFAADSP